MYGSKCYGTYLHSILSLINLCKQKGIQTGVSYICNESLLQRSRNYLADEFLRNDFTHLLFIDADIQFQPEDVIKLFSFDQDMVGVPYSIKEINWEFIRDVVKTHNQIPSENLVSLAGHILHDKEKYINKNLLTQNLVEVDVVTTGFLLIKRHVFEKLKLTYPEYSYRPDHIGTRHFDGKRNIQLFFSVEIDPITLQLTTEYEFFCKLWKNIGGKIYTCPWMIVNHIGIHSYEIDLKNKENLIYNNKNDENKD